MRIVFLGTGASSPPPGRRPVSVLVESSGARLLLDAGPLLGQGLRELGLTLADVDAVVVTHAHLDHYAGLFDAAVQWGEDAGGEPPELRVVVGPGVRIDLDELLPSSWRGRVRLVEARGLEVEELEVKLIPAEHSTVAYAVSVEDRASGVRVLYTGDSRFTSSLLDAARGADLVVSEATLPDSLVEVAAATGHHTVSEAARYLEVARMVALVHLTASSLRQVRAWVSAPRGLLVPSDGSILAL